MMYNLTLKVTNPDGVATTDPVVVKFPATGILFNYKHALLLNI